MFAAKLQRHRQVVFVPRLDVIICSATNAQRGALRQGVCASDHARWRELRGEFFSYVGNGGHATVDNSLRGTVLVGRESVFDPGHRETPASNRVEDRCSTAAVKIYSAI